MATLPSIQSPINSLDSDKDTITIQLFKVGVVWRAGVLATLESVAGGVLVGVGSLKQIKVQL